MNTISHRARIRYNSSGENLFALSRSQTEITPPRIVGLESGARSPTSSLASATAGKHSTQSPAFSPTNNDPGKTKGQMTQAMMQHQQLGNM
jgi:hypothetical protein